MMVSKISVTLALCLIGFTDSFSLRSNSVNYRLKTSISMVGDAIVTIGTRGSPLALAQAYETKRLLGLHFPELAVEGAVEVKKIMTKVGKRLYIDICIYRCLYINSIIHMITICFCQVYYQKH